MRVEESGKGKNEALLYCTLLALQFGLQPLIASKFTANGISKISIVVGTELGKILIAATSIAGEASSERKKIFEQWTLKDSLKVAALPATLYAIQNLLVQFGYVFLDSMTFNLLNQTKVSSRHCSRRILICFWDHQTLSAAFWLWIIMGQPQSHMQMVALLLLLGAGESWCRSRDSHKH